MVVLGDVGSGIIRQPQQGGLDGVLLPPAGALVAALMPGFQGQIEIGATDTKEAIGKHGVELRFFKARDSGGREF